MSTSREDKYKPTSGMIPLGPLDQAAEQWAMNIWTKDDSRSVLRLAPDCIQKAMIELSEDLKFAEEDDIKGGYYTATRKRLLAVDNQIRLSFWLEYERVQRDMLPKMSLGNILRGIMAQDSFLATYLNQPYRVAYMVHPPKHYTVRLSEMLDTGLDQIRDVLTMPHSTTNAKGQIVINTKLLELKFKIMTYVDMRQNGAIAQKLQIEQKNLNVNMKGDAKEIIHAIEQGNLNELDRRLADLRRKQLILEKGIHPDKADVSTEAILISDEGTKDGTRPESEEQS